MTKDTLLEQKNKFSVGETISMIPDGTNKEVIVKAIEDEDGRPMESAPHPKQMIYVDFGEEVKRRISASKKRRSRRRELR